MLSKYATTVIALLATTSLADYPICTIVHDGRVPGNAQQSAWDVPGQTPFETKYFKGEKVRWSEVAKFRNEQPSRFDFPDGKPVDLAINDRSSVSVSKALRTGLVFERNTGKSNDKTNKGAKTFHFSIKQPAYNRPLDLNHQYMLAWHVADDDRKPNPFHWRLILGTALDRNIASRSPPDYFKLLNKRDEVIWTKQVNRNEWENFAITTDFATDKIRVFQSTGNAPLESVTDVLTNDNSGGGRFQIAIMKWPTGITGTTAGLISNRGNQPPLRGEESQLFGGVFVEDSETGCISR